MLSSRILGVGVVGPGLADWDATRRVLRGDERYRASRALLPLPVELPPAEQRRAGRVVRLALAIASQAVRAAGIAARELPSIFTSSGGDGENCHEICVALASAEPTLSPTRFHNSVHNAAAGYWSIAQRCAAPYTALCAHDASFGAGLLEALLQLRAGASAVLLAAYDVDYPPPLRAYRSIPDAFGVALVLGTGAAGDAAASSRAADGPTLSVTLTQDAPTRLDDPELEALRSAIPAARALPLLQLLARAAAGVRVLDYLPEQRLRVELTT